MFISGLSRPIGGQHFIGGTTVEHRMPRSPLECLLASRRSHREATRCPWYLRQRCHPVSSTRKQQAFSWSIILLRSAIPLWQWLANVCLAVLPQTSLLMTGSSARCVKRGQRADEPFLTVFSSAIPPEVLGNVVE